MSDGGAEFVRSTGDLLLSDAEGLINPVNTVGVMGKGLALQFKQAFPTNFAAYRKACARGELKPGKVLTVRVAHDGPRCIVINVPTKRHWREASRLDDVGASIDAMAGEIQRLGLRSVAIPALGCGNGGLAWREVEPLISAALAPLNGLCVKIYPPAGC